MTITIKHIHKSHNVNLLLYHLVCPVKYRRKIFEHKEIDERIKNICIDDIQTRPYEIGFHEIGVDLDHVHFLFQSVPVKSPMENVKTIKSITVREIFRTHEEIIKKQLWKRELWSD
jgi:REP element-mobilizing transposase RayT